MGTCTKVGKEWGCLWGGVRASGWWWGGHTSICLSWKTRWMLRLKADPVNMDVTGYVRSNTGSSTEVML